LPLTLGGWWQTFRLMLGPSSVNDGGVRCRARVGVVWRGAGARGRVARARAVPLWTSGGGI